MENPYRRNEESPECAESFTFMQRLDQALCRQKYTLAAGLYLLILIISMFYLPFALTACFAIAAAIAGPWFVVESPTPRADIAVVFACFAGTAISDYVLYWLLH